MSVTVIVDASVKPESLGDLKTALAGALPDTRAYDGCEDAYVQEHLDNGNRSRPDRALGV